MTDEHLNETPVTDKAMALDEAATSPHSQRQHNLDRIREFEAAFAKFVSMDADLGFEETINLDVSEEELALFCMTPDDITADSRVAFMESLVWQDGHVRYIKEWSRMEEMGSDSTLGKLEFAPDACPPAMLAKMAENLVYLGNVILHQVEKKAVTLRAWNVAFKNGKPARRSEASDL